MLELLRYLYNTRPYYTMKLGLFRIEKLCELLGNPQKDGNFFHITGSNGKGSVTTFIQYLLKEHGYTTTGYFSPHLSTILERFQYNCEPISKELFSESFLEVKEKAEILDGFGAEFAPSFFEFVTAIYFNLHKKLSAQFGTVEVGLGGRFDATNIIRPLVSIITTVSLEHTNVLGSTVEEIAFEKAGIIKENVHVVVGEMDENAFNVIENVAFQKNSVVHRYGRDFYAESVKYEYNHNLVNYYGSKTIKEIPVRLNGTHQVKNVAIALKAFENVIELDEEKVCLAFQKAFIPGRFEMVDGILFDGSHNPQAAQVFKENIEIYFASKTKSAVIGILDDKDRENVLKFLVPVFDKVIITKVPSKRSVNPEITFEIAKKFAPVGTELIYEPEPLKAFQILKESSQELKCVTGSFYLVGYLRDYHLNGKLNEEWGL